MRKDPDRGAGQSGDRVRVLPQENTMNRLFYLRNYRGCDIITGHEGVPYISKNEKNEGVRLRSSMVI